MAGAEEYIILWHWRNDAGHVYFGGRMEKGKNRASPPSEEGGGSTAVRRGVLSRSCPHTSPDAGVLYVPKELPVQPEGSARRQATPWQLDTTLEPKSIPPVTVPSQFPRKALMTTDVPSLMSRLTSRTPESAPFLFQ